MLHILEACGCRQFGDLHATALCREVQDHLLAVAQRAWSLLLKVGVDSDVGFALDLEPAGQSGLVDFSHRAQVVVGYPLPELELGMAHDGLLVKHAHHLLDLIALRGTVVQHHHDGGVNLLAAERHQHTAAHLG